MHQTPFSVDSTPEKIASDLARLYRKRQLEKQAYSVADATAALQSGANQVQNSVGQAMESAKPYLANGWNTAKDSISQAVESAKPYISSGVASVKDYAGRGLDAIKPYFHKTKNWLDKLDPAQRYTILGGGLGAGLGLTTTFLGEKDEDEKRHPIRNALTGAIAGGTAGLGLQMLTSRLPKSKPSTEKKLPEGQFAAPGGEKRQVKPEVDQKTLDEIALLEGRNSGLSASALLGGAGGAGAGFAGTRGLSSVVNPAMPAHKSKSVDSLLAGYSKIMDERADKTWEPLTAFGHYGDDPTKFNSLREYADSYAQRKLPTPNAQPTSMRAVDELMSLGAKARLADAGITSSAPTIRKSLGHSLLPSVFKEPDLITQLPSTKRRSNAKAALVAALLGSLGYLGGKGHDASRTQNRLSRLTEQISEPVTE